MSRSILYGLAASILLLIGLVVWKRGEPRMRVLELGIAAGDTQVLEAHDLSALELSAVARAYESPSPRAEAAPASAREPVASQVATLPREFEVLVVRAEDDTPIEGAAVSTDYYEPRPAQVTGMDGLTRWRWNGAAPEILSARAPGREPLKERAWFGQWNGRAAEGEKSSVGTADTPRIVLCLELRRTIEVRLVDVRGRELEPFDLDLDPQTPRCVSLALSAHCAAPGTTLEVHAPPKCVAKPASWDGLRFAWNLELRGSEASCVHVVVGDLVLASQPIELTTREIAVTVDPGLWTRITAPFVVRVLSAEDGRALAGADVTASTPSFSCTLRTDAEGRALFSGRIVATEFDVEAVGAGHASARLHATRTTAGEIVLRLPPGRTLRGVVVEEQDRPIASVRIGVYRASELGTIARPLAIVESAHDGRFSIAGMPVDALVLIDVGRAEGTTFLPDRAGLSRDAQIVEHGRDDAELVLHVVRDLHSTMWGR